jgi:hypothetical protein
VAGVARRVPALLDAIAEGRLHLTGACEIAPHLTPENADRLLAAVTHKTKEQIRVVVAAIAPRPDLEERITPIRSTPAAAARATSTTESAQVVATIDAPLAPAQVEVHTADLMLASSQASSAAAPVPQPTPPGRVMPLAPERYGAQFTMDQETHELLQETKELLSDPESRRLENIFKGALKSYNRDLKRLKCAATDRPRAAKRPKSPHTITADVKRQVQARDQGQCTFVNEEGQRCPARTGIQYEHARAKGRAEIDDVTTTLTAKDVRLLCGAHNQLMAERLYGQAFMQHKRDSAMASRAAVT